MLFTINDEVVCLWQYDYTWRTQNAVWIPPKQQVPRARLIAPSAHRCFRQRQAPPNGQHFLSPLRFAPSIHDIGSLIQKYRKKIGFWRNYYSYKLIWPCRSVGLERWGDLKIRPQPSRSSHCFITVVLFSVKLKQNSEMLQNQSIKKMSTELFPRHTQILFAPPCSPWP